MTLLTHGESSDSLSLHQGVAFHFWISAPLLPQVPRCCWSLPALCTMKGEIGVPVSVGRGWERSNLLLKNVRKAVNGLVGLKALSNHQFLLPLVFCPWDISSLPDKLGKSNLCMRLQFDQVYWYSTFHTNVESCSLLLVISYSKGDWTSGSVWIWDCDKITLFFF